MGSPPGPFGAVVVAASCSNRLWHYGAGLEGHVNTAACAAARSGIGNGNERVRKRVWKGGFGVIRL